MKAQLYGDYAVEVTPESVSDGGSFRTHSANVGIAYNGEVLRFFHRVLMSKNMPWYIDVGANTGAFTLLACHVSRAKVYSLEPNPRVCEMLHTNCKLNNLPAIIMPIAAWSSCATLEFHEYHAHGMSRVEHPFLTGGETGTYPVLAESLDRIASEYGIGRCDFIKIDVEGAELMVLHGAEGLIKTHGPGLMIEWWPDNCSSFGYHPREIDQQLREWGYGEGVPVAHFRYYEKETEA